MDENCVITPCEKTEYENPLSPTPTESDLVQVYDSIEQITNPNSNHIYVVGNDVYVFDGVSFVSISGCDIPAYVGEYTVTAPSEGDLVLPTKGKLMDDDLTIKVLKKWTEPVLIADDTLTENIQQKVYSILPNGEQFKFDRITVEFFNVMQNNNGFRTYYNRGVVIGNPTYGMIESVRAATVRRNAYLEYVVSEDGTYIEHNAYSYGIEDEFNGAYQNAVHAKRLTNGLEAITTWAWWGCTMYEGSRFVIKGYNRIKQ